jgi:molybdopterin converting factor small subunit
MATTASASTSTSTSEQTSKSTSTSTSTGTFTLLLFASASTFAGDQETLTLPAPTTLRAVFSTLERRFPGMTRQILRSSAVTVNLEYVDFDPDGLLELDRGGGGGGGEDGDGNRANEQRKGEDGLDMLVREGDEVGIIPPVSSG